MANIFKVQDEGIDTENGFGYPTTCVGFFIIGDKDNKFHMIYGTAAPSTNYNNAPTGSLFMLTGTGVLYCKTGASTWVVAGTQT